MSDETGSVLTIISTVIAFVLIEFGFSIEKRSIVIIGAVLLLLNVARLLAFAIF